VIFAALVAFVLARPARAQALWTERGPIMRADGTTSYGTFARQRDRMLAMGSGRVEVLSRASGSWQVVAAIEAVEATNE
jgi:hypothetical protein